MVRLVIMSCVRDVIWVCVPLWLFVFVGIVVCGVCLVFELLLCSCVFCDVGYVFWCICLVVVVVSVVFLKVLYV